MGELSIGKFFKKYRYVYRGMVFLLTLLLLAGCGSGESTSNSAGESYDSPVAYEAMADQAEMPAGQANEASSASKPQADQATKAVPGGTTPHVMPSGDMGLNRKLIYKANLVLQVEDYAKAQTELRDIVAGSGAYILAFNENTTKTEIGGVYTIKIQSSGFVSLLDSIETISKAKQRNVQGQDVTEEYIDLTSRLKAKEVVEKRLLDFMDKATQSDALLAYSNELAKVQEEIEQIKGRMRYLDQNVAFSTIELRMYQQLDSSAANNSDSPGFLSRLADAFYFSMRLLENLVIGVLMIITVLLPFIAAAFVIGWPITHFVRKYRAKSAAMRHQKPIIGPNEHVEPSTQVENVETNNQSDDDVEKK